MAMMKKLLGQGAEKKHKRNFLQENVRRLKEIKPEKENKPNSQSKKNVLPLSVRRNIQDNTQKLAHPPPSLCQVRSALPLHRKPTIGRTKSLTTGGPQEGLVIIHPSITDDATPKGYCSQASQTLNGKQLETLYCEGVVRYPSVRSINTNVTVREMGLQTDAEVEDSNSPLSIAPEPADTSHNQTDIGLQWDEDIPLGQTGNKDFVKLNTVISEPPRTKTADSKPDPNRAPVSYQRGVVPRYLKAHKKELEKERICRAREAADECPEGHVMLPDDIRLSHLTNLKQKYEELVCQLNKLPVSTDTLRTRTRKKEIEAELDNIEVAIALFSREKVFVKANS